jgi:hypothetical protein
MRKAKEDLLRKNEGGASTKNTFLENVREFLAMISFEWNFWWKYCELEVMSQGKIKEN